MRDHRRFTTFLVTLVVVVAHGAAIQAAPITILATATNNATILPGGPRTGTNGKIFLNAEGSNNGAFASFAVIDFPLIANPSVTSVSSLALSLTQSNAAFTANGGLSFFLSEDTTTSIDPGTSSLAFSTTSLPNGLGTQLSPSFLLGPGTFTQVGTGTVDTFTFPVPAAAQSYLVNRLDNGGDLRLIFAPNDAGVSATYAGFANTNSTTPGPALAIGATVTVPAPASLVLLGLGLSGLAAFRVARGAGTNSCWRRSPRRPPWC
jgi:hypothetical protein